MLRLPKLDYVAPDSVEGVLDVLAEHGGRARLLAGGTDLLPNMKHGIEEADVVVSLRNLPDASAVAAQPDGALTLGAMLSLEAVAADADVRARCPALATAAGLVAGPHHRRMGTLGGNVCLNTRCVYINQTHFWRQALGFCLKKDGTVCHVVKGGKRCVAAASNDTAPVLMTLGASLRIVGKERGERDVPIAEFFVQDGVYNKDLRPDELLLSVSVPAPAPGLHTAYAKLRPRDSIDFPRLGVAVAYRVDGGLVRDLRIAVTALASRPTLLRNVTEAAEGRAPDDALFGELGQLAHKQCHPLTSIDGDTAWRREMVPVFVKRALREALERGASA